MKNKDKVMKAVAAAFLALIATNATLAGAPPDPTQTTERCYGIVKAGMNDCATKGSSCSGSAKKDNQPDAFLFMPKGMCEKIVGGIVKANKQTDET